jgi:hypothetical protein
MDDPFMDSDFNGDGDIDADDDAWGDLIFMDCVLNQEMPSTQQAGLRSYADTESDRTLVIGLVVVALLLGTLFCAVTN